VLTKDSILHHLAHLQRVESWQRAVPWVNALFVLILAYILAGFAWRLWPLEEQSGIRPLVASMSDSTVGVSPDNLDGVAALHLFGEAAVRNEVVEEAPIDAPETRLSLTLKGIIALSEAGLGLALIAEGQQDEKLYKVGDTLSGGAVLHEVLADKVILKRGGRFETLTLPKERLTLSDDDRGGRSIATTSAMHQTQTGGSRTAQTGRGLVSPASNGAGGDAAVGQSGSTISQQLSSLREEIVNDPQKAFNLIQAQPVLEGGGLKGYRVTPGSERRLFHGTGLRAGDVVTSVNGVPLSDPAQMAGLFQQFKSASSFNLVVERGGRETNLTINLGR